MTSEETLELLEERCGEHKERAEASIPDQPKKAVFHLSKAADLHERLATNSDSDQVAQAHQNQAANLRENAQQLLKQLKEGGDAKDDPPIDPNQQASQGPEHRSTASGSGSLADSQFFDEPPDMDLSDVGGMHQVKERLINDIENPVQNPEFYQKQGVGMENGILFHGPPGTGKSHLAQAFAGELGFNYAEISASDIVSKYVGEAAKQIRSLFDEAKEHEPCVVFIDEIDALASDRSTGNRKTQSERQMVNELLTCMQEIQDSQVVVIAATNKYEDLDEALTRTGRFNQTFHVTPPGPGARKEILEVQLQDGDRSVAWNSINWSKLVDWSDGFSASDLEHVVKQAARQSAQESTERGDLIPVNYRHLLEAMKKTEASLKHYAR